MSVNVRVVLLVGYDTTLYMVITIVPTKRWILTLPKFDEPFGVRFHFEIFWRKPMSVNARVILLVGYDKTMYTRINEKIDSHITKIRRAFRRSVPF